jgi:hypothetical protein
MSCQVSSPWVVMSMGMPQRLQGRQAAWSDIWQAAGYMHTAPAYIPGGITSG